MHGRKRGAVNHLGISCNVDDIRTDCCILFDTVAASRFSLSWTGVTICLVAFFGGIVMQEISDDLNAEASIKRGGERKKCCVASKLRWK